jgi:hypothetical protein
MLELMMSHFSNLEVVEPYEDFVEKPYDTSE